MASPPDMPVSGHAQYVGGAGGVVQYEFGSSWDDLAGQYALGEYTVTMTVTADFDKGTVARCLGCIVDIEPERRHIASVYEDVLGIDLPDILAPVKDYEIHFAPVACNRDSTFESELVTVVHEERTPATLAGHWDGSFSNVDDAKGNPRLVNGFTDAYFMEPGGSTGILWGIFNALSPALIPEGPPRSGSPE